MKTDRKWIVIRIDGKIAGISTDYSLLATISNHLSQTETGRKGKGRKPVQKKIYDEITATAVCFDDIWKLRQETEWEDLMLFGTEFQKKVWRKLWELTHKVEPQEGIPDQVGNDESNGRVGNDGENERYGDDGQEDIEGSQTGRHLICYSDFAELCQNRAGVRAVAHAIGLNPISVIIPCHLVIPKEGLDKIREIHNKAQSTIFKGDDLCLDSILADTAIDFGEYALGKSIKRELIIRELTEKSL